MGADDSAHLLHRLAAAAGAGLSLLLVGLAALALAVVAAVAAVIGAAARLLAAVLSELARLVQAAWTWIDRHGARGYAVEEKTPNGGWKVRHDI